MRSFITLETNRMILRDHKATDLQSHHLLLSDPAVMYFLPDIQTHTRKESEENLLEAMEAVGAKERAAYFLRMEEKATGEHIGEIGYTVTSFSPVGKMVHLGYFTHQKFWGKGYVTEALREVIKFAFTQNDVFRISTGCLAEHTASQRVMQNCGMVCEGKLTDWEWHDGKIKDRVLYRLLKSEWIQKPARSIIL